MSVIGHGLSDPHFLSKAHKPPALFKNIFAFLTPSDMGQMLLLSA